MEPVKYKEARQKLVSDREDVASTAILHYFNLLVGQINLEIARQNYANADKLYKIAQARFKIGQMSRVDLLQMQNSRLTAESSLTDAQMSLDSRMFQLRSFLGFGEKYGSGSDDPLFYFRRGAFAQLPAGAGFGARKQFVHPKHPAADAGGF
ncbi:MAG: TolC family protein [Alistipes indistinctus]